MRDPALHALTRAARDREARRARVDLVHLVCLVCLVHLVRLVQPNKPNRLNKQERPAGSRPSRVTVHGRAHNIEVRPSSPTADEFHSKYENLMPRFSLTSSLGRNPSTGHEMVSDGFSLQTRGFAVLLVVMDVAESSEIVDSVPSFVLVMLPVVEFKHLPGIVR